MNINLSRKDLLYRVKKSKVLCKNTPIAIYGSGMFAQKLKSALEKHGYKVKYFVNKIKFLNKMNIDRSLKISEKSFLKTNQKTQLIMGINNREVGVFELSSQFIKNPLIEIFYSQDIFHLVEKSMGWCYWLASKNFLLSKNNFYKFKKALSYLSDDKSKQRLFSIYKFRLGLLPEYSNFIDKENQYFNSISIPQKRNIIYCDIGAFDGDTLNTALKKLFMREIYAFEPVSESYRRLLKKIKLEDIRFNLLPLGVSDKYRKIPFSDADTSSESARISDTGNDTIQAISLDEAFNVDFNFIKIDVEGFEKEVLLGAKNTIKRARPVIAMSLYHNSYDLWELPILIKKILPDYKLYVRQHYFNTFDCVLYCIP